MFIEEMKNNKIDVFFFLQNNFIRDHCENEEGKNEEQKGKQKFCRTVPIKIFKKLKFHKAIK